MKLLAAVERRPALAWLIALGGIAAMIGLRWLLDPILGNSLALITLYGAVAAAVWAGGWRPALAAMLVGYLAADYLFIEPRGVLSVGGLPGFVGFLAYLMTCTIIVLFGEALRTASRHTELRGETLRVTLASMGDALITTDAGGGVTSLNRAAEELTGWAEADAQGKPVTEILALLDEATGQPSAHPALRALSEGRAVGLVNHTLLVRKDGVRLPIDDSAAPIRDPRGVIVGCVVVFREITERLRAEKERMTRLSAARLLAAIVESSDDAIISKSLDGVIQSWNVGAERLFGYRSEEAVGRHITLIIPIERRAEEEVIISRLRRGERIEHFDTVRRRSDGREVHVSLTVSPVLDERGRVVGASKIARDITERKFAEDALRDADRRKTEFLAVLAHELRGPLAPLRNATAILKASSGDREAVDAATATMDRQLGQLVRLVDDLIDVSRISSDKVELRRERLDLASVLLHAIEASRPLIEKAAQELTVAQPPEPIYLDADPVRLSQVFANLLNNASKFTPPRGHISLIVERGATDVRISIEDDGAGIPAGKLVEIFDMFTQVDHGAESQGGLGIGLALVRRLVDMHGGSVQAHSAGPGKGSQFIVRLPLAPKLFRDSATPALATRSSAHPRRFLVVDDNPDTAASFSMLLELHGHTARAANDGEEAIRAAAEYRPDIVLLDIGLPDLTGYEVARRIRAQPNGGDMVLVAMTGWGQEEDRRQSQEAGFDHHLVKPVAYDALIATLGLSSAEEPAQPAR